LQAAHEAARWQRELPRDEHPLFVSVNISSRQIFRQNLIQEIRHILGRNIVPKGSLRLEITESLVMENPEQATEILQLLRGAGAELALDEFGTGYSSLAYLQRFPFDTIKIDKALLQSSGGSNGAGSAIVRSMVALSHELGKKVVAEGVETSEDVGFLRSIGCHYGQGFYYGEPMSDREVTKLLKMVRTAEHKLRPRGLFRAVPKQKQKAKKMAKKAAAHAPAAALPPPRPNGVKDAPLPKTSHSPLRPSSPQVAIRQPEAVEQGQQGPGPLLDRTGRSPSRPALSKQGKRNVLPVPPIPPTSPLSPLPQQGAAKPPAGVGDIKGSGKALPVPPEMQPQPQPQAMMKSNEPAPGPIIDATAPASKATSPPVLPPAPPAVAAVSATPSSQSEASLPPAASVPQSNSAGASGASEDAAPADADVLAAALRKATPVSKSAARLSAKSDEPTQPIQSMRPKPSATRTPSAADFSSLPPQMAASLAKLAGVPWPPKPDGDSEKAEEPIEESVGTMDPSGKQMPPK
jgi:EAL domain-containing protein (putative c-di-GMP-specific phosphodiesterase class I)